MHKHVQDDAGRGVRAAPAARPGVWFDTDATLLEGSYVDELSAHRAKRVWAATLEEYFLLHRGIDFVLTTVSAPGVALYFLRCEFTSACGRYAFWRVTHDQAPEAQYLIETAHVPASGSGRGLVEAPDLAPVPNDGDAADGDAAGGDPADTYPFVLRGDGRRRAGLSARSLVLWLRRLRGTPR